MPQPLSRRGRERHPSDRVVAQSKSYYNLYISIKISFNSSQFVKKKKPLLKRRRKLVDAQNVSGQRLNKHRMPLEIYQMRLMEIEMNDLRER